MNRAGMPRPSGGIALRRRHSPSSEAGSGGPGLPELGGRFGLGGSLGAGCGIGRRRGRGRFGVAVGAVGLLVSAVLVGCAGVPRGGDGGGPVPVSADRDADAAARAAVRACPGPSRAASGAPVLPDLTLPCLGNGPAVALRRLAGTPTVINLWASWCGPCRAELPVFDQVQNAAGGRLRVLGVVHEDAPRRALSFAADAGVHFPSVVDENGRLLRGLARANMPTTVFVDAAGRVVEVYTGVPFTAATFRQHVQDRLGVDVG